MKKGLALLAVLAATACGATDPSPGGGGAPGEGWRELAGSPLSPRHAALGLWTGTEALIVGGADDAICPPNADCAADPTPLADGAALDPATGKWRRIADAPVPFSWGQGVVVGTSAYILPSQGRQVLEYRIGEDRWTLVQVPFKPDSWYQLLAAGGRLVAYSGSDETVESPDYVLDAATGAWRELPADPQGRSYDRTMAWTGRELVLFDKKLVPNPGQNEPSLTRAAALDLATGTWRLLPNSQILYTAPWLLSDGKLVNPTLGDADGGEVGNWGRAYPNGGILDPATGQWAALPERPGGGETSGARSATSAIFTGLRGSVLDTTTGTWEPLPTLPGGRRSGATYVAAGRDFLVFGGGWGEDLRNDTWLWP
ncbi:Kelch repeat-containing protein [Phytohabitans aurantiacus]|uniref:Galactose oxidase n=1 Tax=Phytohabitans aurantiacus TaxID=3016789 RepID=A0ABQ5R8E6_9ACTN|nr:hypothetical protein [Phytohabitans aurantiacus]GLI02240.1 hypothetical protein Pa4123_75180 [Phytohabitans aurantiacus]